MYEVLLKTGNQFKVKVKSFLTNRKWVSLRTLLIKLNLLLILEITCNCHNNSNNNII